MSCAYTEWKDMFQALDWDSVDLGLPDSLYDLEQLNLSLCVNFPSVKMGIIILPFIPLSFVYLDCSSSGQALSFNIYMYSAQQREALISVEPLGATVI